MAKGLEYYEITRPSLVGGGVICWVDNRVCFVDCYTFFIIIFERISSFTPSPNNPVQPTLRRSEDEFPDSIAGLVIKAFSKVGLGGLVARYV